MPRRQASIGQQQLSLVADFDTVLTRLEARSGKVAAQALEGSLQQLLGKLQRSYVRFTDEQQADSTDAKGDPRRPNQYTIQEAMRRFSGLREIAAGFMGEKQLAALDRQLKGDLAQAVAAGGELQRRLVKVADKAAKAPTTAPDKLAIDAAAQRTSAFIRGESIQFRERLAQLAVDGVAQGRGYRGVEREIRELLQGAKDPDGITQRMGLRQRAELIARSELSNAYVQAQKEYALANGYSYVRWMAVGDERTCIVCGSRHGAIFKAQEVVGTAHPRCRCCLAAVPNEAVEAEDPALAAQLQDSEFWGQERQDMAKTLGEANGWTAEETERRIQRSLATPTASERRMFPAITESAQAVAGLGPLQLERALPAAPPPPPPPPTLRSEARRRQNNETTTDIAPKYKPKEVPAATGRALDAWATDAYVDIRAAQFRQAAEAGAKLSRYQQEAVDALEMAYSKSEVAGFVKKAEMIEEFISKAPVYKGGPIYRGVAFNQPGQLDEWLDSLSRGEKTMGIESWGADGEAAAKVAFDSAYSKRAEVVLFRVEQNNHGVPIGNFGIEQEKEVLLPRGMRYEIASVEASDMVVGDGLRGGQVTKVITLRQVPAAD